MNLAAYSEASQEQILRRTIPFDYAFRFKVFDEKDEKKSFVDQTLSATLTVSIEASFTAVSIGYGVIPEVDKISFGPSQQQDLEDVPPPPSALPVPRAGRVRTELLGRRITSAAAGAAPKAPLDSITPRHLLFGDIIRSLGRKLGEQKLTEADAFSLDMIGPHTAAALLNGIRLRPDVARKLLLDGGKNALEEADLDNMFETVAVPPERVQFLYALYDEGTGRAFQSEPILNIAGLGIADGDRPFRPFVPPVTFTPQSTIRLEVVPKSEFKGDLHIVLHGYKILGGVGTPTGRAQRDMRRVRRR